MTLMLEIPPELEARLEQQAAREGTDPQGYVRKLLERDLPAEPTKGTRTLTGYGKFRHIPFSSDLVNEERLKDKRRDERLFRLGAGE